MKQLFYKIKGVIGFLLCISIILQTGIVLYNHYTGAYQLHNSVETFTFILQRSLVGFLSSIIVAIPLVYIVEILNKHFPWGKNAFKRILVELLLIISLSFLISALVFILMNFFSPGLDLSKHSLLRSTLVYSLTNLLFVSSIEGLLIYKESKRLKQEAATLRREIAGIKLEILKSQINQHFMFNSLNVLSGLLKKDPDKAQEFIAEFSNIYRYVLESIEQPLTNLQNELKFVKSYLFLQQIRYGRSLSFEEEISSDVLEKMLPPLSLQVILENAIKHNIVNEERPLLIEMYNDGDSLIIRNNFQPKISNLKSTGLGQKNIQRRYQIICEKSPEFILENGYYTAILPLIKENRVDTNLIK
ncbi:MAG: sensor histidine kinase [Bacteroidales bacterium]|nr:sensor histidine kinase [Bacteroidales bacterium]MDD4058926.1 sensor histidine kinase [Bacteroidales bacterium]